MAQVMARAPGLEVHEMPDGYIVYEAAADNVLSRQNGCHYLRVCDGKLAADDLLNESQRFSISAFRPTLRSELALTYS